MGSQCQVVIANVKLLAFRANMKLLAFSLLVVCCTQVYGGGYKGGYGGGYKGGLGGWGGWPGGLGRIWWRLGKWILGSMGTRQSWFLGPRSNQEYDVQPVLCQHTDVSL